MLNNSWDKFIKKSLAPSFDNLKYFARAITPTFLKIGFTLDFL